jgi:hypothetical protein
VTSQPVRDTSPPLATEGGTGETALYPSVKVPFMSGWTEGILSAHGVLEAGINLIEKPFTEKSLLAKLREVIALAADQAKDQAGFGGTGGSAP